MIIRSETPADYTAIRHVLPASFPDASEADLVERLRADGDIVIALVAVEDDSVVGHAVFSRMTAPFKALGLGPIAVHADWRKQGIAARLIERGLDLARETGWDGVFVVGEPDFYKRFGFSSAMAARFDSAYAGPYLMALALNGDTLPSTSGRIDYPPAFAELE